MGTQWGPSPPQQPSPLSVHAYYDQTVAHLSNCWGLVTFSTEMQSFYTYNYATPWSHFCVKTDNDRCCTLYDMSHDCLMTGLTTTTTWRWHSSLRLRCEYLSLIRTRTTHTRSAVTIGTCDFWRINRANEQCRNHVVFVRSSPVHITWTMMIVCGIRGKIVRTVLCSAVYDSCT